MKRFIALLALMLVFGSVTLAQDTKPAEKEDTKTEATEKKGDKVDLTAVHKKGVKSSYQIIEDNTQKQSFMGQESESTSTETFDVVRECTDVDDEGTAKIKFNYERVRIVKSDPQAGDSDYDSKRDKFDDLDDGLKLQALLIGIDFVFAVQKDGDAEQESGYADYAKKISDKVSKETAAEIEKMGADSIVRETFMSASRHLPTEAVAIGDTWTAEWDVSLGAMGSMGFEATYKFEGTEEKNGHKCAKISTEVKMSIEISEDAEVEIEIEDSGSKGSNWVDLETRETVYSEMKTKMVMNINMGVVVKSTNTGTYTVTLKDENFKEKEPAKKDGKDGDKEDGEDDF